MDRKVNHQHLAEHAYLRTKALADCQADSLDLVRVAKEFVFANTRRQN